MPAAYSIDAPRRLVFSRWWGVLTDAHLSNEALAIATDHLFDVHYRHFADLRGVKEFDVTLDGLRHAAAVNPFAATVKHAFVVDTDLAFGMARMFQSVLFLGADTFLITRSVPEALAWLGVDLMPSLSRGT